MDVVTYKEAVVEAYMVTVQAVVIVRKNVVRKQAVQVAVPQATQRAKNLTICQRLQRSL